MLFAAGATAQSHLAIQVHTGHGVNGYDVNSTMISGEKDMIVIDPQFSLSEAHRLAAEISGVQKEPDHNLHHAPASGPFVRTGGSQAGVSQRRSGGVARDRGGSEDSLAGPPEVLVSHLWQQHSGARIQLLSKH